jgi:hypothetical protein
MRLHEVQQPRAITLSSIRGLKQGDLVFGNDDSFTFVSTRGWAGLHRQRRTSNASNASDAPTRPPDRSSLAAAIMSDQHQDA